MTLAALRSNLVATCPIVMELLYGARNQDAQAAITALRDLAGTGGGRHRIVAADALIAACAQEAGVGVLHCDRHFDRLAKVMSFESRWLVRPRRG